MTVEDCRVHETAIIYHPDQCNLYGCSIGAHSTVGPFVEIQRGAEVGKFSKVCSHTFVCSHVTIGNYVFVGHGVMFTNDLGPLITGANIPCATVVGDYASIGSGATILPVQIGEGAVVGAGAVVVEDVPPYTVVVGNPARVVRQFRGREERNTYFAQRESHYRYAVPRRHAALGRVPESNHDAGVSA